MEDDFDQDHSAILNRTLHLVSVAENLSQLVESVQAAIHAGEFDTVEAILQQKQHFIDQLKTLPQLRESYTRSSQALPENQRNEIAAAIQKLESEIKSISATEHDVIRVIESRRKKAAEQLHALAKHRQASSRYRHPEPMPTRNRIDITG